MVRIGRRRKGGIWAAVLGLLLISGCGRSEDDATSDLKIAVIPKGTVHVFWKSVEEGARDAAAAEGVSILWMGPEREDDRQHQIALIENLVLQGMDAIVLAPLDARALRLPVTQAVERGVPVVIIDSGLEELTGLVAGFVGTDHHQAGRLAGIRMAELMGAQGRVAVFCNQEGLESSELRVEGFKGALADYPEIELISEEQYGGATTAEALREGENVLRHLSDSQGRLEVEGIFCCSESTTYGMLQALRRQGKAGSVRLVGFDSSPPLMEALESGDMDALVIQNPYRMGYLGVRTAVKVLRGEPVEASIDTGVTIVERGEGIEVD